MGASRLALPPTRETHTVNTPQAARPCPGRSSQWRSTCTPRCRASTARTLSTQSGRCSSRERCAPRRAAPPAALQGCAAPWAACGRGLEALALVESSRAHTLTPPPPFLTPAPPAHTVVCRQVRPLGGALHPPGARDGARLRRQAVEAAQARGRHASRACLGARALMLAWQAATCAYLKPPAQAVVLPSPPPLPAQAVVLPSPPFLTGWTLTLRRRSSSWAAPPSATASRVRPRGLLSFAVLLAPPHTAAAAAAAADALTHLLLTRAPRASSRAAARRRRRADAGAGRGRVGHGPHRHLPAQAGGGDAGPGGYYCVCVVGGGLGAGWGPGVAPTRAGPHRPSSQLPTPHPNPHPTPPPPPGRRACAQQAVAQGAQALRRAACLHHRRLRLGHARGRAQARAELLSCVLAGSFELPPGPLEAKCPPNPQPLIQQTLLPASRDKGYDAEDLTTKYLNLPEVQDNIGAKRTDYVSCSPEARVVHARAPAQGRAWPRACPTPRSPAWPSRRRRTQSNPLRPPLSTLSPAPRWTIPWATT